MEQFSDIRTFRGHRMNLDAALENMQPNETREVYHMLEENSSGRIVNMRGFQNVMTMSVNVNTFVLPPGSFKCVGTGKDIENNTIIYALCDISVADAPPGMTPTASHSFLQMNTETKVLTWILRAEPLLAFRRNWRVQINVIEGLMYWNFGYFNSFLNNDFNPPRKINIAKAIKYTAATRWQFQTISDAGYTTGNPIYAGMTAYTGSLPHGYDIDDKLMAWIMNGIKRYKDSTGYGVVQDTFYPAGDVYIVVTDRPWQDGTNSELFMPGYIIPYDTGMYFGIDWQVMDRVKYQPEYAPTMEYQSDTAVKSNNLRNDLFQAAFRYVMDDNEKTVFSPMSDIVFPESLESINGSTYPNQSTDNMIRIWYDTGSIEAKAIEIAVRKENIGNWTIIHREEKFDQDGNVLLTNDIYHNYDFYNNELGIPVDQNDVNRVYDAVPLVSKHQEIIEKNRLLDANYLQDFDNIDIDVDLTSTKTPFLSKTTAAITTSEARKFVATTGLTPFYARRINFFPAGPTFWEAGFTYIINISALPGAYTDPEHLYGLPFAQGVYGDEFYNKNINSHASVYVTPGMSFADFADAVVVQLRGGSSFGKVVALNNYSFKTFGTFDRMYDYDNGFTSPVVPDLYIGFVIELTNGSFPTCVYCPNVMVEILKIEGLPVIQSFKAAAWHPLGIVYRERAGRRNTVGESEKSKIYIPSQTEGGTAHDLYKTDINWSINHIPPDWATSYQWVYAKNTSIVYSLYATMKVITNVPEVQNNIAASNCTSICVNDYIVETAEWLPKFKVEPYSWESGDRIRFVLNRQSDYSYKTLMDNLDFEILGVIYADGDGGYQYDHANTPDPILDANGNKIRTIRGATLIIDKFDFAFYGIAVDTTVVEIYRPRKISEKVLYYDFGQPIPIINANTRDRAHGGTVNQIVSNGVSVSPATGTFTKGDTYLALRNMHNAFPVERFSFSDFFISDCFGIGRQSATDPNVTNIWYISKIIYSGRLIQNTRVNDLSRVDASDSFELQDKYGAINHIQEVGDVLKILQKSKPSSMYIGRAGLTQPKEGGTQIMSSTKDVLGTLIVHPSDKGTVHSGSFVKNENRDYFFDFYAHAICRDAGNGIEDLSEVYGIKRFMQDKCKAFGTADNVDVISAYDQANELVFWTFIDKTNNDNSFTLAFRDSGGRNEDGFVFFGQFIPDCYGYSKQILTSFKDNELWLHNSDNVPRCNFYGQQYKYWVTVVINKLGLKFKRLISIFVSTNKKFAAPSIIIEPNENHPLGMVSLLKKEAFTAVQGKIVADFGKNMTTNQSTPLLIDLVNGDDLEGQAATIRLEGDETVEHKTLSVEVQGITTGP